MSNDTNNPPRIVLGMPGYGKQTSAAGRAFWRACRDMSVVTNEYSPGSLLACNFNKLWCTALNMVHRGERVDYFAMLHDDIGCEDFWLDKLIAELEAKQLDVLGVVVPIKDDRGMTSIALHHDGDNWSPECRLTMHEVYDLPETFTSEDVGGYDLLLNTGCWVIKWNQDWAKKVNFTINDRIVFDRTTDAFYPEVESEDWYFSRLLNELGLRIGATRKIAVKHEGDAEFPNTFAWGKKSFDSDSPAHKRNHSPIPNAYPREIPGWLTVPESKALAELAEGKRVLEIGSYCGLSTVCMGRTAEHVTACDYFDGRGTPEPCNTWDTFQSSIQRYGLQDKVTAIHPDELSGTGPFDLVFIDAAHDYESVAADAAKALPLLADGGLMMFHDYSHPMHDGIKQVVDELIRDGGELVSVTDTLAVVKPSADILLEV
jgi:hypothetical protein